MVSVRHSAYHKLLRSSTVVTACVLAFASGVVVPDTRVLTVSTERYLANVVGMTASVQPNEFNTLATELKDRSEELDRREREIDARARQSIIAEPLTIAVLSAILGVQLLLIVANYYFDYRRSRATRVTA